MNWRKVKLRHVVVAAVADDEIHRHVERPIDVFLEAEAVEEGEGQHAGAVRVGVAPDLGAVGEEAVRPVLGERRIGEERRRDRLQRKPDAHLVAHVGFVGEVEVHLHRAGAEHHVEAMAADLRHVVRHDPVARLRHDRRFGELPFRAHAEAEEADAERIGDLAAPGRDAHSPRGRSGGANGAVRRKARTARPARARSPPPPTGSARPMMFSPSVIGSQPSRPCMPSSSAGCRAALDKGTGAWPSL